MGSISTTALQETGDFEKVTEGSGGCNPRLGVFQHVLSDEDLKFPLSASRLLALSWKFLNWNVRMRRLVFLAIAFSSFVLLASLSTPSAAQRSLPAICNCHGYNGPGGPCYSGPGGPAYDGPGGPAYRGPGGACYSGPGGPAYDGPGGPAYSGPGGQMSRSPGGRAYDGPGGPAYDGPGGACYAGPGGPCYSGPGGDGKQCPAICK